MKEGKPDMWVGLCYDLLPEGHDTKDSALLFLNMGDPAALMLPRTLKHFIGHIGRQARLTSNDSSSKPSHEWRKR